MENEYQDYVYVNGAVVYNYREDLGVDMNWFDNFLIILALATAFYFCSFLLLIRTTRQISAWLFIIDMYIYNHFQRQTEDEFKLIRLKK